MMIGKVKAEIHDTDTNRRILGNKLAFILTECCTATGGKLLPCNLKSPKNITGFSYLKATNEWK